MTRQDPVSRAGEDSGGLLMTTRAEAGVPELGHRGRELLLQSPLIDPVTWAKHRKLSEGSALDLYLLEPRFWPSHLPRGCRHEARAIWRAQTVPSGSARASPGLSLPGKGPGADPQAGGICLEEPAAPRGPQLHRDSFSVVSSN